MGKMDGQKFGGREPGAFAVPESISQSIAKFLEEKIIEGEMEAGMRLVPEEIAESLQVSKSPVREALLSLQKENLVSNVPRVGFFVMEIRTEDIDEIYPIRAALIALMIQTILEREFEDGFLEKLGEIVEGMRDCVQRGDVEGYFLHNVQLYNCYSEACPNCRLNDMNRQLGKQVLRFRRLGMALPGRIQRSFELNEALVSAIRGRDVESVSRMVGTIISEGAIALKTQLKAEASKRAKKQKTRPNFDSKRLKKGAV